MMRHWSCVSRKLIQWKSNYSLRHFEGIYLKGLYVTVFAICLKADTLEPRQLELAQLEFPADSN